MQDASGIQEFTYGKMGELIGNLHTFVVPEGESYTFKMEWNYDSWNRIDTINYPDGELVSYGYNSAGQLTSIKSIKASDAYDFIKNITYDKFGSKTLIKYGNDTEAKYTYDSQTRRLSNLVAIDKYNNVMQDIDYAYNNIGNINTVKNNAPSFGNNNMGGVYEYNHLYDNNSRFLLMGGYYYDGNNNQQSIYSQMEYSSSGNITKKIMNANKYIGGNIISNNYENTYQYASGKPHAPSKVVDEDQNTVYTMNWDANGNMTNLYNAKTNVNRGMCWDEENRLMLVRDNSHLSNYIYNAGGERVWKLTGAIERMSVNGKDFIDQANMNKTLYTSPYMVITEKEYTKHYFVESERITSKIGGGFAPRISAIIDDHIKPVNLEINIAGELFENMIFSEGHPIASCSEGIQIDFDRKFNFIYDIIDNNKYEAEQYFYHSDHLGSSSWITDASGSANQHLQYLSFGELLVDERKTGQDARFKFTGKERDAETGFDYFGARYYESDLSIWLSVDPLSDMYPSTSPYMYVLGKPTMLIDPNGMSSAKPGPIKKMIKRWKMNRRLTKGTRRKRNWMSPNRFFAKLFGKRAMMSTGTFKTSDWTNIGHGNNGSTNFALPRGANQSYLRGLRVNGPGPGGFTGTIITTNKGGFMDGFIDQNYMSGMSGSVDPLSNSMNVGFIPGLGQISKLAAMYLPIKPLSKITANVVMAINMQRVNPMFRKTHHVNVHRGAWGTNGGYTLQARFREFELKPIGDRGFILRLWHGKL